MKRMIGIVVIFMVLGTVTIMAQTKKGWGAQRIVQEYEEIAGCMERLAKNASTEKRWDNVKQRTLDQLYLDMNELNVETNWFIQSGGTFTDAQRSRIGDASRRIDKANGEFQYWLSQRY